MIISLLQPRYHLAKAIVISDDAVPQKRTCLFKILIAYCQEGFFWAGLTAQVVDSGGFKAAAASSETPLFPNSSLASPPSLDNLCLRINFNHTCAQHDWHYCPYWS